MRFIQVKQSAKSTWWISLEGNGFTENTLNTELRSRPSTCSGFLDLPN